MPSVVEQTIKDKIIDLMLHKKVLLRIQDKTGNHSFSSHQGSHKDMITLSKSSDINLQSPEANIYFEHESNLYSFRSVIKQNAEYIYLSIPTEIFKVERRENFRMDIPTTMQQSCRLIDFPLAKCRIVDLSLGGVLIQAKGLDFEKIKDLKNIKLKMTLLDLEDESFNCEIRIIRQDNEHQALLLGLQFEKLSTTLTQTIQSMLFQIDRYYRNRNM